MSGVDGVDECWLVDVIGVEAVWARSLRVRVGSGRGSPSDGMRFLFGRGLEVEDVARFIGMDQMSCGYDDVDGRLTWVIEEGRFLTDEV